jgi:hypothetical protein
MYLLAIPKQLLRVLLVFFIYPKNVRVTTETRTLDCSADIILPYAVSGLEMFVKQTSIHTNTIVKETTLASTSEALSDGT